MVKKIRELLGSKLSKVFVYGDHFPFSVSLVFGISLSTFLKRLICLHVGQMVSILQNLGIEPIELHGAAEASGIVGARTRIGGDHTKVGITGQNQLPFDGD